MVKNWRASKHTTVYDLIKTLEKVERKDAVVRIKINSECNFINSVKAYGTSSSMQREHVSVCSDYAQEVVIE